MHTHSTDLLFCWKLDTIYQHDINVVEQPICDLKLSSNFLNQIKTSESTKKIRKHSPQDKFTKCQGRC